MVRGRGRMEDAQSGEMWGMVLLAAAIIRVAARGSGSGSRRRDKGWQVRSRHAHGMHGVHCIVCRHFDRGLASAMGSSDGDVWH